MAQEVLDLRIDVESEVVQLLNKALAAEESVGQKVAYLTQVQTLVINHDILDNFLDEILCFQSDPSPKVRCFVVNFIETVFKKDHDYVPKLIANLKEMLADESSKVLKNVIQALTQLCKIVLLWVSKSTKKEEIESTWEAWSDIKNYIVSLLDSHDNDGVRTQSVKFVEVVVIFQTRKDEHSCDWDFSLDELSFGQNKLFTIESLEEEASSFFDQLKNFQSKMHISSVNLLASMQSLALIARQRTVLFFHAVMESFEQLRANLPPTLVHFQLNSVNKMLKLLLLNLFKHPYVYTSKKQSRFAQILLSVGASNSEMNRCLQDAKKRGLKVESLSNDIKRIKVEMNNNSSESNNGSSSSSRKTEDTSKPTVEEMFYELSKKFVKGDAVKAWETNTKEMTTQLSNTNVVCDLVMTGLQEMPEKVNLPLTPISDINDLPKQINEISKQLAMQVSIQGLGPGMDEVINRYVVSFESMYTPDLDPDLRKKVVNFIKKWAIKELKKYDSHQKVKHTKGAGSKPLASVKIKHFNLDEISQPLGLQDKVKCIESSIIRITQNKSKHFSVTELDLHHKIIGKFFVEFSFIDSLKETIKDYVFRDIRNRYDVLFNAIYVEYVRAKQNGMPLDMYSQFLKWIIENIIDACETQDRDFFLHKFYMEAPCLTDNSIELLQKYITSDEGKNEESFLSGMTLAKLLIEKRPRHRQLVLNSLIATSMSTSVESSHVFILTYIKEFYQNAKLSLSEYIEEVAMKYLNMILDERPEDGILNTETNAWSDVAVERCLSLYLALAPLNHKLLHKLPTIYMASADNTKRIILRKIQSTIQQIGMKSTEILRLVETCPSGAETLLSRVVSILTEKQQPSPDIVARVRQFYQTNGSDVRFLIPIINGMSKKEIIDILPQMIKLNPIVVKEVFNRLTAPHADSSLGYSSPISPADLLIALHNINPDHCDLKMVIKATSLCFEDKNIFNSEVLAVAMQRLVEQEPLPTLLMRTVILSLNNFPRLKTLVLNNILQKLILRQVWNYRKVWEGFIRCCQRMQCHQMLLQLPPTQLKAFLDECPDMRPQLVAFLQQDEQHLTLVPRSLMDVIFEPTTTNTATTTAANNNNNNNPAAD